MLSKTIERQNVDLSFYYKTIYILSKDIFGRRVLSKMLGLTESKARTLLNHLEKNKFIDSTPNGYLLTLKGIKVSNVINKDLISINSFYLKQLISSRASFGAILKNIPKKFLKNTCLLRDMGIRGMANETVLLKYDSVFSVPNLSKNKEEDFSTDLNVLNNSFTNLPRNSFLLICGADNNISAENSVWYILSNFFESDLE